MKKINIPILFKGKDEKFKMEIIEKIHDEIFILYKDIDFNTIRKKYNNHYISLIVFCSEYPNIHSSIQDEKIYSYELVQLMKDSNIEINESEYNYVDPDIDYDNIDKFISECFL